MVEKSLICRKRPADILVRPCQSSEIEIGPSDGSGGNGCRRGLLCLCISGHGYGVSSTIDLESDSRFNLSQKYKCKASRLNCCLLSLYDPCIQSNKYMDFSLLMHPVWGTPYSYGHTEFCTRDGMPTPPITLIR